MQKTLFKYTDGDYQKICDYSQYITDETQFSPTYLWDKNGEGQLYKITNKEKDDVKKIHDLIKKQPVEKNKLIRVETLRRGSYDDYRLGKTLNFGIRSATRDKEFLEKIEKSQVAGFGKVSENLNQHKNVKFVFNSSKSLDISSISAYEEQEEELIRGPYRIVRLQRHYGKEAGWEYIDIPMTQYVEENGLETELRISKKGKEMSKINAQTVAILREMNIRKARDSFWAYCCLLSPDFYKSDRWHLWLICETLQALYERRLTKSLFHDLCTAPNVPKWYVDTVDWDRLQDGMIYTRLMQNLPPRHGKCLAEGTMVKMADGSFKKIENIFTGEEVQTFIEDSFSFSTSKVLNRFDNGEKPCKKITLFSGRKIVCTGNHPLYTINGLS